MGTGVLQVAPWEGNGPALRSSPFCPNQILFETKGSMTCLHGGDYPQFFKARHIYRLADFDMLHAMTAVTFAVHLLDGLISIQGLSHRAIPATMDCHLQTHFVTQGCHACEVFKRKDGLYFDIRLISIRIDVEGRVRFPN